MERKAHEQLGALRHVPYMGVIHVVAEATKLGFENGHPDWCNLGQGQPEVGEMEGAPPRVLAVEMDPADCAYGPLEGTAELRAAVAAHYNRLYRRGRASRYTAANVAIAGGGRLALSRAMAALARGRVGYQNPDYTAYQDMLALHLERLEPVAVESGAADGFAIPSERLRRTVREARLGAFLFSNPCNPTGVVIQGEELARYVAIAREERVTLLCDEFYSHFVYRPAPDGVALPGDGPVSAASHVEDVERDPVLLFDGLTKSFRYPGWRLGWVVGPSAMVESLARTASSLDGGPSRVVQRAALDVLEPARADQETRALRSVFCEKRNRMLERLRRIGVRFVHPNASTFYCWGSLAALPAPLDDGQAFFRAALARKVMTVPGEFFDIDPAGARRGQSAFRQWMRFSFGPPLANVELGLARLEALVAEARAGSLAPV
jgi:aspartate/methionine/tyrosine aminotransferase